jgi:hypothetical protein
MDRIDQSREPEAAKRDRKKRDGEIWIIIPFFLVSSYMFAGSFQYKVEASTVPMFVGLIGMALTGVRLFHLLFPRFRLGRFKEVGLAEDFDSLKKKIETKTLGKEADEERREYTFADEKKPILALIGSFAVFLLFGYLVGSFLVVLGTSFYFGFRKKKPISITLGILFVIVWVVLYKFLRAPADFGLLLKPLLKVLHVI